ncbi:hypothetical protein BDR04DRAFT_1157411 [Suillus decipiens]|nr:hypothetical protein BDR04DRAFT_1157411 [Suillus decipiens]
MRPQVWPNWHSIGHDDLRLLKHSWCEKILAWKVLNDYSCNFPVSTPPSLSPIHVELPSPPIIAGNVAGPSTTMDNESWVVAKDKGKGKAVLEPAVDEGQKHKSLIMSEHLQPLQSAMKGHKRMKSTWIAKFQELVELEDDEVSFIQPISKGVLEVILPQHSSLAKRMSRSPCLPHSPCSPKKQSFGPALHTASSHLGASPTSSSGLEVAEPPQAMSTPSGSHPEVAEAPQAMSTPPVQALVVDGVDILILRPVNTLFLQCFTQLML